ILLLTIVVLVGLGTLAQFNRSFADYLNTYFGAYLECLLEAGELPSLGYEGGSYCDSEYQPFTLAEGRPPTNLSGGSTSTPTSSGSMSRSDANQNFAEPGSLTSSAPARSATESSAGGAGGGAVTGRFDPSRGS